MSIVEKQMQNTEEDLYRITAQHEFQNNDQKAERNFKYRYVVTENTLNINITEERKHQKHMLMIVKDTDLQLSIFDRILMEKFTTPEDEEFIEKIKRILQYNEDAPKKNRLPIELKDYEKYTELKEKYIKDTPGNRKLRESFQGVGKYFTYDDAHKYLKFGATYQEWNSSKVKSKEVKRNCNALIKVIRKDFIFSTITMIKSGKNPVVVLEASHIGPGNQWRQGKKGIEEEAYYRTSISYATEQNVTDHFYPLKENSVNYTPKNIVTRYGRLDVDPSARKELEEFVKESKKSEGYIFDYQRVHKSNPIFISFIQATGYISGSEEEQKAKFIDVYINKFRDLFSVALFHGHTSVFLPVLGAYLYEIDYKLIYDILGYVFFNPEDAFYTRFEALIIYIPQDIIPTYTYKDDSDPYQQKIITVDPNEDMFKYFSKLNGITHVDANFVKPSL
jgi:hypothetical protein